MYIISACLAGRNCKYNGGNNECAWVEEFIRTHRCVLVCPEEKLLGTPRQPVEIISGRAIDKNGRDVTDEFSKGALQTWGEALIVARGDTIKGAILKSNSPSCGSGAIYDGTFTGNLVDGDGFFAKLLKDNGVKVTTEKENMK